jgi:hypothetical protein
MAYDMLAKFHITFANHLLDIAIGPYNALLVCEDDANQFTLKDGIPLLRQSVDNSPKGFRAIYFLIHYEINPQKVLRPLSLTFDAFIWTALPGFQMLNCSDCG